MNGLRYCLKQPHAYCRHLIIKDFFVKMRSPHVFSSQCELKTWGDVGYGRGFGTAPD
jgi:hypothetical protein